MNFKQIALALLVFAASANWARADDTQVGQARFSDEGRLLVAGALSGHWSSSSAVSDDWAISIQPSLAYFVRDRIGLGLMPGYSTGSAPTSGPFDSSRFHEVSLGVYGIFDVALAERVSLLLIPTLGYAYRKLNRSNPLFASPTVTGSLSAPSFLPDERDSVALTVHLPLVYHASSSVVLGLGPYFSFERVVGGVDQRVVTSNADNSVPIDFAGSNPFSPERNTFHVGVSSFIGASFYESQRCRRRVRPSPVLPTRFSRRRGN